MAIQSIERLGGILLEKIEDAASATHIIAGDGKASLRRTPKLMIGLCKTTNIVNLEWLVKSAKSRKVLPTNNFRLLSDKEAEKQYQFSMRELHHVFYLFCHSLGLQMYKLKLLPDFISFDSPLHTNRGDLESSRDDAKE